MNPIPVNTIVPGGPSDRDYGAMLVVLADNTVVDTRALVFTVPGDESVDAPEPGPASGRDPLLTVRPNPTRGVAVFDCRLPVSSDHVSLVVYDVRGHVIRRLLPGQEGHAPGATVTRRWDGRDERGQRVAAGMYFAALEASGRRTVRRVVVLPTDGGSAD